MQLWLVGQFKAETDKGNVWELQGVFSSQELAEKACINESCFVAPICLDVPSPEETRVFPGMYYPSEREG